MFREGDAFDAIAAVRAGTVKTYVIDREGREQVLGFFLPGEVIGLNAISQGALPVQCRRAGLRSCCAGSRFPRSRRSLLACPACSSSCSGC